MDSAWHLSIDFGTSNTAAAHTPPHSTNVEALALTHRSNIMPSAVFASGPQDSQLLTGDSALSRGRRDPSHLLLSPKRYIDHDNVQLAGQDIPLKSVVGAVIAAALRAGKAQHANQDPATVTLTHPEAWSAHSIDQLKASAARVGIPNDRIRTISEPRAAAVHYASQQQVRPGTHVAVFDFGGGTLDVAVLEAESNGNFRVVAAKGDNSLGGRTVDNLMYRWILDQIDHDDPDRADELRAAPMSVIHSLESNIREAKEMLSDTSSATISVSTPTGETDLLITREEFNEIISQSVTRAVELTQATLQQAGADTQSTPIYMTGGSSRIPFVQNRLGEVGTVMTLDDPKTVVSRGALVATLRGFTGDSPAAAPQEPQQQQSQNPTRPTPAPAAGANAMNQYGSAPQTQAFASPAAPAYGSAPQSQNNRGGGKGKLLAAGGILAVLLLGAGGFALLNNNGNETEDPSGDNTSNAVSDNASGGGGTGSSFTEATPFPDRSDNRDSGRYRSFTNLYPESKDFLPTNFYNRISSCGKDPEEILGAQGALDSLPHNMHQCLTDRAYLGEHSEDFVYSGFKYALDGKEAKENYDLLMKAQTTELQKAENGWPEIQLIDGGDEYTRDSIAVWYPDREFLITLDAGASYEADTEKTAREVTQFFNFAPPEGS